jgi:hypothetical protein
MKKQIIAVSILAALAVTPVAFATPYLGIGYTNVGLSGHAGRPGVTLFAGNLYRNNVLASGSASYARGYYSMGASLGKVIPAGGVSFEPYVSMGFLNFDYNQQETGYTTTYGYSFTSTTPYSYTQSATIQDFYGLAGANLNIPIGSKVALRFGGGYGHTISTFGNGNGGQVYKGSAEIGFKIAPHVSTDLQVAYLHVPGASLTNYGMGLSYHFS